MLYQNYTRGQIKTFFDGVFLCGRTQGGGKLMVIKR